MKKNDKGREPAVTSKKAAIERATSRVSELFEVAPGRWCYHVWSAEEDSWIPGLQTDAYAEARRKRAGTIAAMAVAEMMGNKATTDDPELTLQIIGLAYDLRNSGTVQERVNQILDELR